MLEFKSKITGGIPQLNRNMTAINLITQQFATDFMRRRPAFRVSPLRVSSLTAERSLINVKTHLEGNSAYLNAVSGVILKDF